MAVAARQHRLLERDSEVAAVESALRDASGGSGQVLAIAGAAGIGKTTLLREARGAARHAGFTVLAASGTPLERELPFGVARQLFEPVSRDLHLVAGGALAGTVLQPPPEHPAADLAHSALVGLHRLAVDLASSRGPLLFMVDDAHWADSPSLRWLAYLCRRIGVLPIAVVVAHRSGEPGTDEALLASAVGEAQALVLRPEPLSAKGVRHWLGHRFGRDPTDELVNSCIAATGGNPFLLEQVTEALDSAGVAPDAAPAVVGTIAPAGMAAGIAARIEPLGAGAQELLEVIAVLSGDARLDRAAALTGLSLTRTGELADRLADAGILAPGEPLTYRHPVLRSAVYDRLAPHQRTRLHAEAGALLLNEGTGVDRAAAHLLRVPPGGRAWAVPVLRDAAAAASARGAPDAAIPLLRRALAEEPRDRNQLRLALIEAEVLANDPAGVADARTVLAGPLEPSQRIRAAILGARAAAMAHRFADAEEFLACAEAVARGEDPEIRQAVTVEALEITLWKSGTSGHGKRLKDLDPAELDETRPLDRMLLACTLMDLVTSGASRPDAERIAERLLVPLRAGLTGDDHVTMVAARSCTSLGHFDTAIADLTRLIDSAQSRGVVHVMAAGLGMRGEAELHRGRLWEAEADALDGLELALTHGLDLLIPPTLAMMVRVLIDREGPKAALEQVRRAGFTGEPPQYYTTHILLAARGAARAAAGDEAGAIADLRECGRRATAWGETNPSLLPWRSDLALLLHARAEDGEAGRLAADELERARRFGAPHAIAAALRCAALLASGVARVDGLRAAQAEAADRAPLAYERATVDLGVALRAAGRRVEAREVLTRGLDAAHRDGARRLAARAREELFTLGARPRRERIFGRDALTASELRVARLAAAGRTNRQIAEALFVTLKTVEMHLSRTYAKLGVPGRDGLKAALDDGERPWGRPPERAALKRGAT